MKRIKRTITIKNKINASDIEISIIENDIHKINFRPYSSSITGCERKHIPKNSETSFKFRYPDLEINNSTWSPIIQNDKSKKLSIVEITINFSNFKI